MKILSPKVDFVFKRIFGNPQTPEILISFLNAVLNPKNPITTVNILNTDVDKEFLADKFSRLDVKATTSNNEFINIEIQLRNQYNIAERSLYYWSKIYSNQLLEGEDYSKLSRTICINIIDFNYLDTQDDDFHSVFKLSDVKTHNELINKLEIHFIELKKFKNCDITNNLDLWIEFINSPASELLEDIKDNNKELITAKKQLHKMSGSSKERIIYDKRQQILIDELNALNSAHNNGFQLGIEQGIIQIAKNLLDILDDETIAIKTGLSIPQIQELRSDS